MFQFPQIGNIFLLYLIFNHIEGLLSPTVRQIFGALIIFGAPTKAGSKGSPNYGIIKNLMPNYSNFVSYWKTKEDMSKKYAE